MTPQLYQQYLQAASAHQPATSEVFQQVFQTGLLYPHYQQQVTHFSPQNFHPQFENFNYNEQTQESAHGSDSFPSASSINVGVKRAVNKDTGSGNSANSIKDYLDKTQVESNEVGVISNQVDYEDEDSTETIEKETFPNLRNVYYTSLPNKQTADALATLAAAGSINHQMSIGPGNIQAREEEMRKQKMREEELRAEEERKRQIIRHEEKERANEIRYYEEQREQSRNQEMQEQQNRQVFKDTSDKQNFRNQDEREPQKSGKENQQVFTGSDYSEEEIMETSDKDQRNTNSHMPIISMRPFDGSYREGADKESQTEEQSYEDSDADYSQEEVKEINNANKMTQPPPTEKTVNYNSHQNQLPFGAKLRPKRV
ncbi:alpha-protein kinase 1-like [Macrosteles quadrilineatus]|uniref:alpha-protein kinase 1-like n=1 Tax=Macrosteles quadrilineatus TaxID=74068 RepID=UPI0023E0D68C|nr:alpha-protein kinase 1-like [Macrosteles quadrilineatus]